jgi:uncharacterized protein (TIGR04255 family)
MPAQAPLGRWSHAPLAYVVTELQFQRVSSSEAVLEKVAEVLAEAFPVHEVGVLEVTLVSGDPDGKPVRQSAGEVHDFRNFDTTVGVRITPEAISMHSVVYTDWPAYQTEWMTALATILPVLKPRVVTRTGLRYVDLIVPDKGRTTTDYFAAGLRPWSTELPKVGKLEQHNLSARFKADRISSKLVVLERVTAGFALPPNFQPMALKFSEAQQRAVDFQRAKRGAIALMDLDIAIDGPRPMLNSEELRKEYEELHAAESALFRAAISPLAVDLWQGNVQ